MTPVERLRALLERATPGPWVVHPVRAEVEAVSDALPVCAMLWPTDARTEAETEANASLIAALPLLLDVVEAAQDLYRSGYDGPFMGEPIEELFRALARLEGTI